MIERKLFLGHVLNCQDLQVAPDDLFDPFRGMYELTLESLWNIIKARKYEKYLIEFVALTKNPDAGLKFAPIVFEDLDEIYFLSAFYQALILSGVQNLPKIELKGDLGVKISILIQLLLNGVENLKLANGEILEEFYSNFRNSNEKNQNLDQIESVLSENLDLISVEIWMNFYDRDTKFATENEYFNFWPRNDDVIPSNLQRLIAHQAYLLAQSTENENLKAKLRNFGKKFNKEVELELEEKSDEEMIHLALNSDENWKKIAVMNFLSGKYRKLPLERESLVNLIHENFDIFTANADKIYESLFCLESHPSEKILEAFFSIFESLDCDKRSKILESHLKGDKKVKLKSEKFKANSLKLLNNVTMIEEGQNFEVKMQILALQDTFELIRILIDESIGSEAKAELTSDLLLKVKVILNEDFIELAVEKFMEIEGNLKLETRFLMFLTEIAKNDEIIKRETLTRFLVFQNENVINAFWPLIESEDEEILDYLVKILRGKEISNEIREKIVKLLINCNTNFAEENSHEKYYFEICRDKENLLGILHNNFSGILKDKILDIEENSLVDQLSKNLDKILPSEWNFLAHINLAILLKSFGIGLKSGEESESGSVQDFSNFILNHSSELEKEEEILNLAQISSFILCFVLQDEANRKNFSKIVSFFINKLIANSKFSAKILCLISVMPNELQIKDLLLSKLENVLLADSLCQ